jgi:hypothetical protein
LRNSNMPSHPTIVVSSSFRAAAAGVVKSDMIAPTWVYCGGSQCTTTIDVDPMHDDDRRWSTNGCIAVVQWMLLFMMTIDDDPTHDERSTMIQRTTTIDDDRRTAVLL